MEAVSTEEVLGEAMEALSEGPEEGEANANGGRKRKNNRKEHFGPKKRKLNLHNCITRTVEASPRTPVRILMELGQQQKFHINYQFAEPPPRPNFNKSESGASDDNGKEETKSSDENMEVGGDEIKKEPAENGVNCELDHNNGIKKEMEDEEKGDNGTTEGEKDKDNNGEDDTKRRRPWDGEERPFWKRQFSCTLNARGFTYEGKGRTKQDAKNAAAEEASVCIQIQICRNIIFASTGNQGDGSGSSVSGTSALGGNGLPGSFQGVHAVGSSRCFARPSGRWSQAQSRSTPARPRVGPHEDRDNHHDNEHGRSQATDSS